MILGGGPAADDLERLLLGRPDRGLLPVAMATTDLAGIRRMDDARVLAELARDAGGREAIVLPGNASDVQVAMLVRACADEGLGVAVHSGIGDAGGALTVEQVGPVSLVRVRSLDPAAPALAVKHALDRFVAGFALLCVAPVFLALALAVRLSSPRPGPVPPAARRPRRPPVRHAQVPLDAPRPGRPAAGPSCCPTAWLPAASRAATAAPASGA